MNGADIGAIGLHARQRSIARHALMFKRQPLLQLFPLHSIKLEDTRRLHWCFEPIQELRGRVHLVVVPSVREDGHLMQVFGKPRRLGRQKHEAVFDQSGLGMHAHDLVTGWLIRGHRIKSIFEKILDQRSA